MENENWSAGSSENKRGGIPIWVWIVGGIGVCAMLGVCVVAVGLYLWAVPDTDDLLSLDEGDPVSVDEPLYHETFQSAGDWGVGDIEDASVDGGLAASSVVMDGTFEFIAYRENSYFWSTAEESFGDGVYEVTATTMAGPENNGFGMMFMLDETADAFYLFEVSSDGYVLVAYCVNICDTELRPLDQVGWFESAAVVQGVPATNHLRVVVEAGTFTFFVNDQEVAQATDATLQMGNIGILVETFEETGVQVQFDDFIYTPSGS